MPSDKAFLRGLITMEESLVYLEGKQQSHCGANQMEIECHSYSSESQNRLALPLFWLLWLREAVNKWPVQPFFADYRRDAP